MAIVVLTQGILVTLLLIDQILDSYTDYSVYGALRKYYQQRVTVRRKGCKFLHGHFSSISYPAFYLNVFLNDTYHSIHCLTGIYSGAAEAI